MKVFLIGQSENKQDLLYQRSEELLLIKKQLRHESFDTGHRYFVLWHHPGARVSTATFLRFTAELLSPIERPIDQRRKQK